MAGFALAPGAVASGPPPVGELAQELRSDDGNARRKAVELLGESRGREAVDALLGAYRAEVVDAFGVKAAVAAALGELGAADAAGPLAEMLGDEDYWVRRKAAEALGRTPGPAASAALLRAARDADPRVRAEAVRALGRREGGAAAAAAALEDVDRRVVLASLEALAAAGSPEASPALTGALGSADPETRCRAASLLAARGDERGLSALAEASRSPETRRLALREAGRAGCGSVPLLTRCLDEAGGEDGAAVLAVLEGLPCAEATEVLLREALCGACEAPLRVRAASALFDRRQGLSAGDVDRVAALLSETDPDLVAIGLQVLAERGSKTHLGAVGPLARHANPVVRRFAIENLGKFGGPEVAPALVAALADPNGGNVRLAVEALGRVGTAAELPALRPLLEDRLLRRAAQAAVEAIEARP